MDHFQIQDALYAFPYHHIPNIDPNSGEVTITRSLSWGLEYLCYQYHVIEKIEELSPESVLEIGCGDGFLIGHLSRSIGRKVGIDFSERAIGFARAFFPQENFIVGRSEDMDEEFELVAAVEVLEHVPDSEVTAFFQAVERRLRRGGTALISVPTTVIPLNKKHYRHYDENIFAEQLMSSGANLQIVDMQRVYKSSWRTKLVERLAGNRFFRLEIEFLTKWTWAHTWKNSRIANKQDGRHLVVTLRK